MKAEIKEICEPDHVLELAPIFGEDRILLWVNIHCYVGIEGQKGGDIFSFRFVSLKFFEHELSDHTYVPHQECIVVQNIDLENISATIEKIVSSVSGETWEEIARAIDRYGRWEFRYGPI